MKNNDLQKEQANLFNFGGAPIDSDDVAKRDTIDSMGNDPIRREKP